MKTLALAAFLMIAGPGLRAAETPAEVPGPIFEERAVWGFNGNYLGTSSEISVPSRKKAYRFSAQVKTFRYGDAFHGTAREYSVGLRRELYHVTLKGRLGTQPPSAQRSGYHLAYGEALFTLYGLDVGPEHPELSPAVWESTEPAPSPQSFDRSWVTRIRGRYTNTDHHVEFGPNAVNNGGILVLVQNSWQFDLRETWREKTSASLHWGFHRYNKELLNSALTVFLNNVDYPGNDLAIRGWPNNYVAVDVRQRFLDRWEFSGGATHLNLLNNQVANMYGVGLDWTPAASWRLGLSYYHLRRRFIETREAAGLRLSYLW